MFDKRQIIQYESDKLYNKLSTFTKNEITGEQLRKAYGAIETPEKEESKTQKIEHIRHVIAHGGLSIYTIEHITLKSDISEIKFNEEFLKI